MTIIKPKKNKKKSRILFIGLVLVLFVLAYWNVAIYVRIVDLRYALDTGGEQLQQLKVGNADLKNQLYLLTATDNLTKLAKDRGLTEVKSPQYLEIDRDPLWSAVSASQF